MTAAELLALLHDPAVRAEVQRTLGMPSEPVAEALAALTREVQGLGAAQARTDAAVKELAAAQRETDAAVKELGLEVKALAAAQRETDAAVKELGLEVKALAAAQRETDVMLKELLAAQQNLTKSVHSLRTEVGALADNVGLGLEELAAEVLPDILARRAGITVARFERRFVVTDSGEEEVDLFAEGEKAGVAVSVIGEAKSRIYAGDVQKFDAKAGRIAAIMRAEPIRVMLGFMIHPKAREMAERLGIHVVAMRPAA
jgi:hypothetical protein